MLRGPSSPAEFGLVTAIRDYVLEAISHRLGKNPAQRENDRRFPVLRNVAHP
jgi:hypothetical protein